MAQVAVLLVSIIPSETIIVKLGGTAAKAVSRLQIDGKHLVCYNLRGQFYCPGDAKQRLATPCERSDAL